MQPSTMPGPVLQSGEGLLPPPAGTKTPPAPAPLPLGFPSGLQPSAGVSLAISRTRVTFQALALSAVLALAPAGCAIERVGNAVNKTQAWPPPEMPVMAAANPAPALEQRAPGSLWTPGLSGNPFSDDKAFRKGDIVLVRIVQKSSGTKQANVDTKRNSTISANIKYFLGMEKSINKLTGYVAPAAATTGGTGGSTSSWDPNDLINAQTAREYAGTGSSARTDALQATVSAVVTDVLTNGNLTIFGHQTVMLDHEASVLTVQGIIRPSDIAADNSIDSGRISNANIQFTGSGVITDQQQPGWATRAFDWVWPF